jgi:dihydroxyacetone kinase
VLINGLGATPAEELYILYRRVHHGLEAAGHAVHRAFVGEYATSLEMVGASVSLLHLSDELTSYLDASSTASQGAL